MTAATMAFLLAASAPFQAFAEEANPDSSYSVDQERLTDNQLDYDEIGARVKEYYGPIKSAYNMVRGMTEDQGQIAVNERTMADDLISQARAAEDLAKDQTGMDQMINKATAKALRKTANQMRTMANNMDRSLSRKNSSECRNDVKPVSAAAVPAYYSSKRCRTGYSSKTAAEHHAGPGNGS